MMKLALCLLAALPLAVTASDHGKASWYGYKHAGRFMANGQRFNPEAMTCASWHYPLGTRLKVSTALDSVTVTVTDRGPSKRIQGRIIDLSLGAFRRLAGPELGLVEVRVEIVR